jgi:hypothetical protein
MTVQAMIMNTHCHVYSFVYGVILLRSSSKMESSAQSIRKVANPLIGFWWSVIQWSCPEGLEVKLKSPRAIKFKHERPEGKKNRDSSRTEMDLTRKAPSFLEHLIKVIVGKDKP